MLKQVEIFTDGSVTQDPAATARLCATASTKKPLAKAIF